MKAHLVDPEIPFKYKFSIIVVKNLQADWQKNFTKGNMENYENREKFM